MTLIDYSIIMYVLDSIFEALPFRKQGLAILKFLLLSGT